MDYPIVIKNAADPDLLCDIMELMFEGWVFQNYSLTNGPKFWNNVNRHDILILELWVRLSFQIRKHLKCRLRLDRIMANGQTFNQVSQFHQDRARDDWWTCVIFTASEWNTEWGGEFVCYDPFICEYKYVPYIPNTAVVFPSNWQHKGNPPCFQTSELRTSLAFTFEKQND